MGFPIQRLRRLRQTEPLRRMVRETRLSPSDLVHPFFVTVGRDRREAIPSMPGQYRLSQDLLAKEVAEVQALGIPAVMLFSTRPQCPCVVYSSMQTSVMTSNPGT